MLSRSDSENIASNYFRSKRASQILSTDPMKSLSECSAYWGLPSSTPTGKYAAGMNLELGSLSFLSCKMRSVTPTSQDQSR